MAQQDKSVVKLAYVLTHPIQYQSPLLRRIAAEPGIALTVLYTSDFSVRGYKDIGFGTEFKWDVPLLEGYEYKWMPKLRDAESIYFAAPLNAGFLREFVRGKYDAVWVHGYATVNSLHALVAAKLAGAKTLLRTDSTLIDRERGGAKRAARRMFFRGLSAVVDGVLTTGRMNAEYWSAVLPGKRQFLMPYAVDNAWFAAKAREAEATREELRAELGFERGRAVILFAGKLMERKRCGDLIAAHAAMADPKPYLLIVGDGEQRAALEAQATDAAVKFVGFKNQSELPRYYDLCDVFVLPSVHEPWGLIVNEVMASARAVIVSDEVGCWPDLVRDGESGFVVPARDVGRLGAALTRVTSEPGLARRMGEAGARRIAEWSFEEDVAGLRKALGELRA